MSGHGSRLFDREAGDYDAQLERGLTLSGEDRRFFAQGRAAFLARWWREQRRAGPTSIVDWGCGNGEGSVELAHAFPGASLMGVDPSGASIEAARARFGTPGLRFSTLEDAQREGVAPADLVHLNGVVHHVPVAERPDFFARLGAQVKPGGVLALFDNNPLNPGTHLVMARIAFDRDAVKVPHWEARRRLRAAGLLPERARFLFVFPRALRGLRALEPALEGVPLGAQCCVIAHRGALRPGPTPTGAP